MDDVFSTEERLAQSFRFAWLLWTPSPSQSGDDCDNHGLDPDPTSQCPASSPHVGDGVVSLPAASSAHVRDRTARIGNGSSGFTSPCVPNPSRSHRRRIHTLDNLMRVTPSPVVIPEVHLRIAVPPPERRSPTHVHIAHSNIVATISPRAPRSPSAPDRHANIAGTGFYQASRESSGIPDKATSTVQQICQFLLVPPRCGNGNVRLNERWRSSGLVRGDRHPRQR